MSSLHLIRSLRHALGALRDAGSAADADRVAALLILELENEIDPEVVRHIRRRTGVDQSRIAVLTPTRSTPSV